MSSPPELEIIRRAQIMEATIVTISKNGYANVTMDDICKAAKMSKGGLAYYFKSKNDLFKAAFEEFFNRIFDRSREIMDQVSDPIEKLLSFELLYDAEDPDTILGYPLLFDCVSIAGHQSGSDYRKLFHEWVDHWIVLLKSALDQAIGLGILKQLDSEAVARTISAIYQGVGTRWYIDREGHSTQWAVDSCKKAINGLLAPYLNKPNP